MLKESPFSIAVGQPNPAPVIQSRNLLGAVELPPSAFHEDTVAFEYDILTPEEKKEFLFFHRHGIQAHHAASISAVHAHAETGDVDQLHRAIAILLHLEQTQHPDA